MCSIIVWLSLSFSVVPPGISHNPSHVCTSIAPCNSQNVYIRNKAALSAADGVTVFRVGWPPDSRWFQITRLKVACGMSIRLRLLVCMFLQLFLRAKANSQISLLASISRCARHLLPLLAIFSNTLLAWVSSWCSQGSLRLRRESLPQQGILEAFGSNFTPAAPVHKHNTSNLLECSAYLAPQHKRLVIPISFASLLCRLNNMTEAKDASNKTIALVTGANKGIGFSTVERLAGLSPLKDDETVALNKSLPSKNLYILLGARDKERGEAAVADLKKRGAKNVEFLQIDIGARLLRPSRGNIVFEQMTTRVCLRQLRTSRSLAVWVSSLPIALLCQCCDFQTS